MARETLNILSLANAVGTTTKDYPGGWRKWFYLFNCSECADVFRLEKFQIKTATGKCQSCAHQLRPHESIFNTMSRGALKRKLDFELTYEQYLLFVHRPCHYCAGDIVWARKYTQGKSPGYNIDRKDNSKGYLFENCVPCCPSCNLTKRGLSDTQFIEMAQKIAKQHPTKE